LAKSAIAFSIGSIMVAALLVFLNPTGAVVFGVVGAALMIYGIVAGKEDVRDNHFFDQLQLARNAPSPAAATAPAKPNLVFVFGAPLGDNASTTWVMKYTHFGPSSAHNCDIGFFDQDRKNIEHRWLVAHPNVPYPQPNLTGESQRSFHVAEASREGSAGHFLWNPLNPNAQHYSVSISCRDGVFEEKWEITRVNDILRSRITIKHGPEWVRRNPNLDPVVFRYEDPEFVETALAVEVPKEPIGKAVHPGWKPNYQFAVPVAIIDSNQHVQVVSGVKQQDGSTRTDFGSWNILTQHFGD
jgi:hypothetical protein